MLKDHAISKSELERLTMVSLEKRSLAGSGWGQGTRVVFKYLKDNNMEKGFDFCHLDSEQLVETVERQISAPCKEKFLTIREMPKWNELSQVRLQTSKVLSNSETL